MFSNSALQNDAAAAAQAGTIIVLIDESSEMDAPIAGGTKSKAEGVATAVNSMLNQLTAGPDVRLAIVGYGGCNDDAPAVQIRWTGPLSGRVLVNSSELATAPKTVEERVRRIPGVGGIGVAREETVLFPIWHVPAKSGVGGIEQAADFISQTLPEACADSSGKPPLVIHICGKMPTATQLQSDSIRAASGKSIWCHLHLGASDRIPATLYPSSGQHLSNEDVVALLDVSTVLTEPLVAALQAAQVGVAPGARGLVHQATMGDLIRFLMLAKAYVSSGAATFASLGFVQPTVAAQSVSGQAALAPPAAKNTSSANAASPIYDRVALIVLADRSQTDPASGAWPRRQEQVNDLIGRVAKRAGGNIDVGLILYGNATVDVGFTGPLQGKALVPDLELTDGAIRVEQVTEKVSNGIGGLVELTRSRPIYVECESSEPAHDLEPAMAALSELIEKVRQACEGRQVLTLVMHVTGGDFSPEATAAVADKLAALGDLMVYHSIVPETPQSTVAYPADPGQIADPKTVAFWQITSPLAGADKISEKRSTITADSRGLVVGAKFDLLLDSIQAILPTPVP